MDISRYHSINVDVILPLTLVIPDLFVDYTACNFEHWRGRKTATKCMTLISLLYTNFRSKRISEAKLELLLRFSDECLIGSYFP